MLLTMTRLHYCLTMIMNYELVEELRWSFGKLFQCYMLCFKASLLGRTGISLKLYMTMTSNFAVKPGLYILL